VRGELTAAGFDVSMLDQDPALAVRAALETVGRELDPIAAFAIVRAPTDNTAEIWVCDRIAGKSVIQSVRLDAGGTPGESSPSAVLAVQAVELLKASLAQYWLASQRRASRSQAETGTGVVLNPQGNLKMKCGIPPIRALQDAGVRIGLGCDNCSCSDAQNMFMAMKLFALLAAASDALPGPPQAAAALRAATEAGADSARLGGEVGRIAPGCKADLTLIDMSDPSWFPLNSAVRQLVHVEAGRGVRHVIVDGAVVVRDRRLTTIDEDEIYDAVQVVMPGFRRDFTAISERVQRLQPWLDQAHQRIVSTELDFDRIYIPF